MRKVRRRDFEQRVRDFVDAAQFVTDRPLLIWSPTLDKVTKALVKEVARIRDRRRAWEKEN